MRFQQKIICILVLMICILMLLAGCGDSADAEVSAQGVEEPITLRLLVDNANEGSPTGVQLDVLIKAFEDTHENVTIEVEQLEDDIEAREIQKQQLRVEIMAGQGPDLFLFFKGNTVSYQLFPDLNQVMRNAVFADLSSYYDSDASLG